MDAVFASKWLMPRIDLFRKQRPDIELRFDITSQLRDFDHDDVDIAIRFGAGKYPGLVAERLFDNVIIPVCSPTTARRRDRRSTSRATSCITRSSTSNGRGRA